MQDSGGAPVIEASCAFCYAKLTVAGNATLSGLFEIDYVVVCAPTNGTSMTVVRAGSASGKLTTMPPDMDMTYTGASVIATYDNTNNDG